MAPVIKTAMKPISKDCKGLYKSTKAKDHEGLYESAKAITNQKELYKSANTRGDSSNKEGGV